MWTNRDGSWRLLPRSVKAEINVATMQVFRDKRGGTAVMVVETDQVIPQSAIDELESKPGIIRVKFLDPNGSV